MGGEYYCYAADITLSYPVSGKFSEDQRFVYETVLAANRAVLHAVRPGVAWVDMHLLAERTMLEALKARGCLTGASASRSAPSALFLFAPSLWLESSRKSTDALSIGVVS